MATDDPIVVYRDIPGFPGYRVGDDGSVWSCWRGPSITDTWKRLKPGIHKKRTPSRTYLYLHLWRNGKRHTRLLHRIILESFVGPRPDGLECRHLDGNPFNNSLDNITWGTHAENTNDTWRLNKFSSRLTANQVREIRIRYAAGGIFQHELAEEFGTTGPNISSIITRQSWKHLED